MNQFLDAATATGAKLLVYCEQWYHWVAKISTACNGISDESLRMLSVSEASGTVSGSRAESFFIFLIKSRTGLAENHEIEGLDASGKTRVTHRLEHDSARHWELHRCCYLRLRWRRGDFEWICQWIPAPRKNQPFNHLKTVFILFTPGPKLNGYLNVYFRLKCFQTKTIGALSDSRCEYTGIAGL
jgi:hypothetical protein